MEGGRLITMQPVELGSVSIPEGLDGNAALAWDLAMKSLAPARLISHGDLLALEAVCRCWGRWKTLEEKIAGIGSDPLAGEVQKTPNGYLQISALRIAANQALKDFMVLAREFGLTPMARVKTAGQAQLDLFDDTE